MNMEWLVSILSITGALSAETAFKNDIFQMFVHAGLVVKVVLLILVTFSVISWAIIFIKWRFFRNARHETAYFMDLFWGNSEMGGVYKESDALIFSPVALIFRAGYS
jgi:biopolymer transport protein TolQ